MTERVALMGDLHGRVDALEALLARLAAKAPDLREVWQVGGLGLVWNGHQAAIDLEHAQQLLEAYDVSMLWTPRNHEHYGLIGTMLSRTGLTKHDVLALPRAPHITLLPRGHAFEWAGRTVVSLGGVASVDRRWRVPGKTWWKAERITPGDVKRAIAHGSCDILLTHEAPHPMAEPLRMRYDRLYGPDKPQPGVGASDKANTGYVLGIITVAVA